jgi:peptidyl-prolyl cis-trans isomerase C
MYVKKRKMLLTLSMVLGLSLFAEMSMAGGNQAPKKKVAVVNGSEISKEDLDREMNLARQRLLSKGKSLSDSELAELRKGVLENLIDQELLYQQSKDKGIKVDEAAVQEQLRKIKGRFPSEEAFKSTMTKMGLSEEIIEFQLERGMAIKKFIETEFVEKATISEKDTKTYYDRHPDFFKKPERVQASHILIKVDSGAEKSKKNEARKKIAGIQKRVKEGEDFASLAKEFSEDTSSGKGGDLGYFGRGQMVKPFEDAAFELKPGEVSDIVETRFGYHLIQVVDKKPETTIAYEDVKERIEAYLKNIKVKEEVKPYLEKLKKESTVERL